MVLVKLENYWCGSSASGDIVVVYQPGHYVYASGWCLCCPTIGGGGFVHDGLCAMLAGVGNRAVNTRRV